jgi:hypothetical protein
LYRNSITNASPNEPFERDGSTICGGQPYVTSTLRVGKMLVTYERCIQARQMFSISGIAASYVYECLSHEYDIEEESNTNPSNNILATLFVPSLTKQVICRCLEQMLFHVALCVSSFSIKN